MPVTIETLHHKCIIIILCHASFLSFNIPLLVFFINKWNIMCLANTLFVKYMNCQSAV